MYRNTLEPSPKKNDCKEEGVWGSLNTSIAPMSAPSSSSASVELSSEALPNSSHACLGSQENLESTITDVVLSRGFQFEC